MVAAGLMVGVDWRQMALVAGALWFPVPMVVALAAAVTVARRAVVREAAGRDLRFVEAVAGELRAGSSLRSALRTACGEIDHAGTIVRRLEVGEPLEIAMTGIGGHLPSLGHLVESAVTVGAGGGRMLPVFEELRVHAASQAAAESELRTSLAPIRASMALLVGAPAAYLAWAAWSGRLIRHLSLPGGLGMASVGALLFGGGLTVMLVMMRRRR